MEEIQVLLLLMGRELPWRWACSRAVDHIEQP